MLFSFLMAVFVGIPVSMLTDAGYIQRVIITVMLGASMIFAVLAVQEVQK
jgi:hypothetical protein